MDPTLIQVAAYAFLDVAWPLLPADVLAQLAYI